MTPPPVPHRQKNNNDGGDGNLHKIVLIIIGIGIILAIAIVIGIPAFFKYMKQRDIDMKNAATYEAQTCQIVSNLKSGKEFRVHDREHSAGDSYMFQLPEGDFAPVPQGAQWIRPFICRIDNMVPDSAGRVSVIAGDGLRAPFAIDSLVFHNGEDYYTPVQIHFDGKPTMTGVLTYINADIYNHCVQDSINFSSYILFIKGFIFDSGSMGQNHINMPGKSEETDADEELHIFALNDDDFAPVVKGATGVKQFVCSVDNKMPDQAGRVFVGTANARAWLNIDSLVNKTADKNFEPVRLKVNGSNDVVTLTDLSITTRKHTGKKQNKQTSYNATIHGYVFTTDSITSQL
ncbi:MAG: hypothetical protein K2G47_05110 [Muribaculum sp.]|nr:hypothetical protein [Muribaculum sp.]